jgi:hypothetical protein
MMVAMSIPVDVASLGAQIARFGPRAFVVTTSAGGPPHIASVLVTLEADNLVMRVGRTTRVNATGHPAVTLLWTTPNDDEHCLIVDGTALDGPMDNFLVAPAAAVLHRLAGAPSENAQP